MTSAENINNMSLEFDALGASLIRRWADPWGSLRVGDSAAQLNSALWLIGVVRRVDHAKISAGLHKLNLCPACACHAYCLLDCSVPT